MQKVKEDESHSICLPVFGHKKLLTVLWWCGMYKWEDMNKNVAMFAGVEDELCLRAVRANCLLPVGWETRI